MSDLFHFSNHPSLSTTVLSVIIFDSGFVFPWICDRKNIYHMQLTSEVLFCGNMSYYLSNILSNQLLPILYIQCCHGKDWVLFFVHLKNPEYVKSKSSHQL